MKFTKLILLPAIICAFLTSCEPDPIEPPPPGNEGEVITTMILTFTDSANATNTVSAAFRDADGEGGNAPTIDTLKLDANTTYFASVNLLDETKSPAANISEEVEEEANEHQLFYRAENVPVTFMYEDLDTNNPPLPLGLKTRWRTGSAATGSVNIILKHQPGTKNNSISTGETDIDVSFPTVIK